MEHKPFVIEISRDVWDETDMTQGPAAQNLQDLIAALRAMAAPDSDGGPTPKSGDAQVSAPLKNQLEDLATPGLPV